MLSPVIKKQIELKLGRDIRYHSDLECLCIEIEQQTKQKVSLNTLKRLFGFISGVSEPRLYTLDTIALYLGFTNWDIYLSSLDQSGNSGFNSLQEIRIETLTVSSIVEFGYDPDRRVQVRYEGQNNFKVVLAINSKLKVNDLIEITHFVLNYPLVVLNVYRDGKNMGRFTAGKVGGLTTLKLI
jgi:hypothetical protein